MLASLARAKFSVKFFPSFLLNDGFGAEMPLSVKSQTSFRFFRRSLSVRSDRREASPVFLRPLSLIRQHGAHYARCRNINVLVSITLIRAGSCKIEAVSSRCKLDLFPAKIFGPVRPFLCVDIKQRLGANAR